MTENDPTALEIHADQMDGQATGWGEIFSSSGTAAIPFSHTTITTNTNYPSYPFTYPNQYVPPVGIPMPPMTYQVPVGTYEILTEERVRQIIREELVAYHDEGKDVLAAPCHCDPDTCTCGDDTLS